MWVTPKTYASLMRESACNNHWWEYLKNGFGDDGAVHRTIIYYRTQKNIQDSTIGWEPNWMTQNIQVFSYTVAQFCLIKYLLLVQNMFELLLEFLNTIDIMINRLDYEVHNLVTSFKIYSLNFVYITFKESLYSL